MSAQPPFDFGHYKEWRRTQPGRKWFRRECEKYEACYHCDQCGYEVWMDRVTGPPTMLCPYPCNGTLRQMEPAEEV